MAFLDLEIQSVCQHIRELLNPQKILVFHRKGGNDSLTGFKVCVVTSCEDVLQTEHDIYMAVDCPVPFDVVVYTPEEWERLKEQPDSFAQQILKNGVECYGPQE